MRLGSTLAIVLVLARVAAAEDAASVELPIEARNQAAGAPDEGWCGETALQEALLHYGAYVPQRLINRAGKPAHPDLYWGELPAAMRALGLRFRPWAGRGGLEAFLRWTTAQLGAGRPVLAGVKIYPTAHPEWGLDHMVLLTAVDARGVRINTTWGRAERRSRAELDSTRPGLSLRNRARRQHAFVIDGVEAASGVRLVVIEEGAAEVKARVVLSGLEPGARYRVTRAERAGGPSGWHHTFTARAAEASIDVAFAGDRAAYFAARRLDR